MKPRDEERSTRIRVKQRESWEGTKGNLDESTALFIYTGVDPREEHCTPELGDVDESTLLSEAGDWMRALRSVNWMRTLRSVNWMIATG